MRPGVIRAVYCSLAVLAICVGLMGSPSDIAWEVVWLITGCALAASGLGFAAWLERHDRRPPW